MTLEKAREISYEVHLLAVKENYRACILDYNIIEHIVAEILHNKVKADFSEEEETAALNKVPDYFNRNKILSFAEKIDWNKLPPYYHSFYEFLRKIAKEDLQYYIFDTYFFIWMHDAAEIFATFCNTALSIAEDLNKGKETQK